MEQAMWMDDQEALAEIRSRETPRRRNRKNHEIMEEIRIERIDYKNTYYPGKDRV